VSDEFRAADALLDALRSAGIDVIFANLGSDHPAVIEALAAARERGETVPMVVISPHESTALAAAHGYTLVTGRAQAVFVHVDVGTANLGGSVHNAARSQIPVLLFAGATPYTLEGELPGTRNTYVNHLQDVHDQAGLVRPYVKWSYDIRTGRNVRQLVLRALQIARSSPRGPVYLTGAREVLAEPVQSRVPNPELWSAIEPLPARQQLVDEMVSRIAAADFPVLITTTLGRDPESVGKLVRLAELLGIGVVETVPTALSFPTDHELHLGFTTDELLERADVVIAVDTDSPWLGARSSALRDAFVYYIDADPLKEGLPLWYMESDVFVRADSPAVLDQLLESATARSDRGDVVARVTRFAALHQESRAQWRAERGVGLSAPVVADTLARLIDDDAIVLNEAITNSDAFFRHLPRRNPGTMFANGGTSLGWACGAAVGVKLAEPDRDVIAIVGDGTFFLSSPSSVYWMSHRYAAPFLTIVLDNGGWNATKRNVQRQYREGIAERTDSFWVNLGQSADLPGVAAAAGGAFAATVDSVDDLERTLATALAVVREGRSAVVAVRLSPISEQVPERGRGGLTASSGPSRVKQ
jgi:acetolactate synthase-1/2/3 large subunit